MYSDIMGIKVSMNVILVTQMPKTTTKITKPGTIQPPSALLFRMLKLEGCWDAGYCSSKEPEVQQKLSWAIPSITHGAAEWGQIRAAFWDGFFLKVWWFVGWTWFSKKKHDSKSMMSVVFVFPKPHPPKKKQHQLNSANPQKWEIELWVTFAISLDIWVLYQHRFHRYGAGFLTKNSNCSTCKTPDPNDPTAGSIPHFSRGKMALKWDEFGKAAL